MTFRFAKCIFAVISKGLSDKNKSRTANESIKMRIRSQKSLSTDIKRSKGHESQTASLLPWWFLLPWKLLLSTVCRGHGFSRRLLHLQLLRTEVGHDGRRAAETHSQSPRPLDDTLKSGDPSAVWTLRISW